MFVFLLLSILWNVREQRTWKMNGKCGAQGKL